MRRPPRASLTQIFVVFFRFKAEQRQGEVLLPAGLAMAAAGIAAELGEHEAQPDWRSSPEARSSCWVTSTLISAVLPLNVAWRVVVPSLLWDQPTARLDFDDAARDWQTVWRRGSDRVFAVGRFAHDDNLLPAIGANQLERGGLRSAGVDPERTQLQFAGSDGRKNDQRAKQCSKE